MSAKKAARPSTPKPGTGAKQANRSASRGAARERAARMREQQRRAERRRRSLIQAGAVVAVLALTVGIGIAVQAQRNSAKGPAGTPRGVVDGTGFAAGPATAKATVVLYEDFQCP